MLIIGPGIKQKLITVGCGVFVHLFVCFVIWDQCFLRSTCSG